MKEKLKIAFFSFTSCQGCYWEFLNLEEKLLDLLKVVEIVHFKLIKQENKEGPYDVVFVEGGISTKEELRELKEIRKNSLFLVALGTCACWGGVPLLKNFIRNPEKVVYPKEIRQKSIPVASIDKHVEVDYSLRGCPISKEELIDIVKDIALGKTPKEKNYCVCVECKERGIECQFDLGNICMGPITYAGCGAPCPEHGTPCDGCTGPLPDGNIGAEVQLFKQYKVDDKHIKRMLNRYAGASEKIKGVKK